MRPIEPVEVLAKSYCRAFAMCVLLAAPAAADAPSRVEILAIGGYAPGFSLRALDPLENAIAKSSAVALIGIDAVPASYKSGAFHYDGKNRDPGAMSAEAVQVDAFDTPNGTLFLTPAEPGLLEAVLDEVKRDRMLPWFVRAKVRLTRGQSGTAMAAEIKAPRPTAAHDRSTMALIYHLTVRGRPVDAVFLLRTRGGLGRLASLLTARPADGAARIVVSLGSPESRGGPFSLQGQKLFEALDQLGLQVSAMGRGELRHSGDLNAHRQGNPGGGVKFLSTNMPFQGIPGSTIVEAGGLKVGFIGITDPAAARYARSDIGSVSMDETLAAARKAVKDLEPQADLIVALSNLNAADNLRLRENTRGLDLVIGAADAGFKDDSAHETTVSLKTRGVRTPALAFYCEPNGADRFDVALGPKPELASRPISVRHEPLILDDSLADAEGYPRFSADFYALGSDTAAVVMPSADRIFPPGGAGNEGRYNRITSGDFWTLVATMFADRTKSEIGLIPISQIAAPVPGNFGEGEVRTWFGRDDSLVVFEISGSGLESLVKGLKGGRNANKEGYSATGELPLAVGGLDGQGNIHGAAIDSSQVYRVLSTARALADSSVDLDEIDNLAHLGDLQDETIAELKRRVKEGWEPRQYAAAMQGRPVREKGYWTVNFRDVSFAASQARFVRDSTAFAGVPGDRINNYDDHTVSSRFHIGADHRYRSHKWTNELEIDYSESEVTVPDEPVLIHNPDNRVAFQTSETLLLGSFPLAWMGRSMGPTLGFRYEGEVKREDPNVRRRNTYSILPGIEIHKGTWVESLQLTGNFKRDYFQNPPRSDYGMRVNMRIAHDLPMGHSRKAALEGKIWSNYFFRKQKDAATSLLLDGSAEFKLQIPIWKNVTLAPFFDIYFFKLKARPVTGYSTNMGVSLGFSRLWKPQYEKFF